MTTIKQYNTGIAQWETIVVGEQGPQGAQGAQGSQGADSTVVGPQGPAGITISATAPAATTVLWADTTVNSAPVGPIYNNYGYRPTAYYSSNYSVQNSPVFTAVNNRTYYVPFVVYRDVTFDRTRVMTNSTYSGNGVTRMGIYADGLGIPSTLLLDAGTVATSAALTTYEITISATLSAGLYWLAVCQQTAPTTPAYYGHQGADAPAPYNFPLDVQTTGSSKTVGYYQDNVIGPFAAASISGTFNTFSGVCMTVISLRVAP